MSSSTTSNRFREKIAAWVMAQLADATVQWGDGGINPETEETLSADPEQSELGNTLLTNDIASIEVIDDSHLKIVGRLEQADLVGEQISEAAVFDSEGDLCAVRNFGPKVKEADETYEVDFIILF